MFKDDVACALDYTNYNEVVAGFGAEGIKIDDESQLIEGLTRAKVYFLTICHTVQTAQRKLVPLDS